MDKDKNEEKPAWWVKNERTRREMDLPEYTPPRFADGVYTHEIVPDLEAQLGCDIQFVGLDPQYPEDWYVRIDGEAQFRVGRRRDDAGNTVYQLSSDRFWEKVMEVNEKTDQPDAP